MNPNTREDPLPEMPADTHGDTPPARKRTAKNIAVQTTPRKTVVKKVAAKKTGVRKTAAKKVAAPEPSMLDPLNESMPKKRSTRAKKPAVEPVDGPPSMPHESSAREEPGMTEPPKRFGRVPGGGPVVSRETPPQAPLPQPDPPAPPPPLFPADPPPPRPPQPGERHTQGAQTRNFQNRDDSGRPSRSKRRREKRKNRNEHPPHGKHQPQGKYPDPSRAEGGDGPGTESNEPRPAQIPGPKIETEGMLELAP
ncbi:MAG: hypothetical protein NTV46_01425, partial [Verrucomicrobia bacterium]|nr:hypothetical protein [Verrucomicrobiota bacterium]